MRLDALCFRVFTRHHHVLLICLGVKVNLPFPFDERLLLLIFVQSEKEYVWYLSILAIAICLLTRMLLQNQTLDLIK